MRSERKDGMTKEERQNMEDEYNRTRELDAKLDRAILYYSSRTKEIQAYREQSPNYRFIDDWPV